MWLFNFYAGTDPLSAEYVSPAPFVKSRFAPQGAVACIRAASDFYYDIVFRWVQIKQAVTVMFE